LQKSMNDPDYRRIRRSFKKPMNFECDEETRGMLRALATSRRLSMAATLRQLIWFAHAMELKGTPTCANGRDCYVPHLHGRGNALADQGDQTP